MTNMTNVELVEDYLNATLNARLWHSSAAIARGVRLPRQDVIEALQHLAWRMRVVTRMAGTTVEYRTHVV